MEVSRTESITLISAVIGTAVLDSAAHAPGAGSAAAGNLAILLALFAFDGTEARSGGQSIAFGGVTGLCLLAPVFFLAKTVLGVTPPADSPWFLVGAWLIGTLIMFGVDRFRMSSKDNVSLAASGLAGAPPTPIISSAPPMAYRPAPIRVEPVYTPPAASYTPPPPPPPPVPEFSATSAAAPAVQTVAAPPDVLAIPPGREAVIYLNLVGEGLNVLRTVRAENLGRDYYRIADVMPEGEQWEFTPGQVVRCRKKSLSNGKHMVAFEEAPRA